jgi:hypothetical protein
VLGTRKARHLHVDGGAAAFAVDVARLDDASDAESLIDDVFAVEQLRNPFERFLAALAVTAIAACRIETKRARLRRQRREIVWIARSNGARAGIRGDRRHRGGRLASYVSPFILAAAERRKNHGDPPKPAHACRGRTFFIPLQILSVLPPKSVLLRQAKYL